MTAAAATKLPHEPGADEEVTAWVTQVQGHVQPALEQLLDPADERNLDPFWSVAQAHLRELDRKSTRLNSSHWTLSRMPSSA